MGKRTKSEGTKPLSTTKKQKFVGSTLMVNPNTGEAIPMQLIQVEDRDFSFHKVWLENLIMAIDGISNQRLRLAFWILDHLDSENKLVMTQRAIAKEAKMSLDTVTKTMKALQDGDPAFLQKINSGAYRVNPDILWKGSHNKRLGVIFDYAETQRQTQEAAGATQKPIEVMDVDKERRAYETAKDAEYLRKMKELNPDMTDEALKDFAKIHGMERGYAAMAQEAAQEAVEAPEAAEDTQEPLPGQMALEAVQEAVAV